MMFQTLYVEKSTISRTAKPHIPEYMTYIGEIAKLALQEQTPKMLKQIRGKFYELLTKGITADEILKQLTKSFLAAVPDSVKPKIVQTSVLCDI